MVLPGREARLGVPMRDRGGSPFRRRRPSEREGASSSSSLVKLAYIVSLLGASFPDTATALIASSSSSLTISAIVACSSTQDRLASLRIRRLRHKTHAPALWIQKKLARPLLKVAILHFDT